MNKIHKSSPYWFGGSEHFLFFHHMWDVILPIDFHIFQRGRSITNQICLQFSTIPKPIGSMYGLYANIWGILMVNVTIYTVHGSYGKWINGRFLAVTPTEST